MTPGRRLGVVVAVDAVGAVLLLIAAGRTWLTVLQSRPRPLPDVLTPLTGADLGGTRAVGLLALAAVAALPAARGRLRPVVGLVLVVGGIAALVEAAQVVTRPESAMADPALSGSVLTGSSWPLVAAAGAALVALAGVLVLAWRSSLGGMSTRYARPADGSPAAPATAPQPPEAVLWDALDAGRDPTRRPGDGD